MDPSEIRIFINKHRGKIRVQYWDPNTRKKVHDSTWVTEAQARDRERVLTIELANDRVAAGNRSKMLFRDYAENIYWPNARQTLAPQTYQTQREVFSVVLAKWGDWPLGEITIDAIDLWIEEIRGKVGKRSGRPLSTSRQRQIYHGFSKVIRKAVERRFIGHSPLPIKPGLPKDKVTKPERILLPEEIVAFADAAGERGTMIYTLAYSGLRIGELLALRRDDLDVAHNWLSVDESVKLVKGQPAYIDDNLKQDRSHRSLPLPGPIMAMLAAIPVHGRKDLLWEGPGGGPARRYWFNRYVFEPARVKAGIEFLTPHDMRHTAASAWFDEGYTVEEVARFLGDTLAVTERTYIHMFRGRHDPRMAAMEARLQRGAQRAAEAAQAKAAPQRGAQRAAEAAQAKAAPVEPETSPQIVELGKWRSRRDVG